MKEITILSGKGGTGKTSITAAFAAVAQNSVFCDSDVDAADLHLILHPEILEENTFAGAWQAEIDDKICTGCGICIDYCRFDAIHVRNEKVFINSFQCEGCRLCERVCPEEAISSKRNEDNFWYVSSTRFGTLVHAQMAPGQENSGKLVTQVRERAKELANNNNSLFIINDGPPGIGCATIASLSGSDIVIMVIEPTMSGLHDAKRLAELIKSFNIPVYAIMNKSDINPEESKEIEHYLKSENIPLLASLPFDKEVVYAMVEGKTIVEYNPGSVISKTISQLWQAIKSNTL